MPWTGTGTPTVGVSHDLTTLAAAKEYLRAGDDDNALIGNLIDRTSAEIETICNRYFNTDSYADWFDGNGSTKMYLENWPVTAVTRVGIGRLNVLDLQIQNMGGIAVALDLHLEAAAWRLDPVPMILLLDREADRFLAERAQTSAELVKPVDASTLRRTAAAVLEEWGHGAASAEDSDDTSATMQ